MNCLYICVTTAPALTSSHTQRLLLAGRRHTLLLLRLLLLVLTFVARLLAHLPRHLRLGRHLHLLLGPALGPALLAMLPGNEEFFEYQMTQHIPIIHNLSEVACYLMRASRSSLLMVGSGARMDPGEL